MIDISILIKGMDEMPEDGAVLVVRHDDNGKAYIKFACTYGYSMELVKLPEQHSRLIDAEKLMRDINKYHLSDGKFQHWVEVQPTVIEAEGE